MNSPRLSAEQISQISGFVADYISAQRQKAALDAVPLSPAQKASLREFFVPQVIDAARLVVLEGTRVENPPFYPLLRQMGFLSLPDFSSMAAVTFGDVIVSDGPFTEGLLFHELVHVEQYRQLGVPRFAELYVRGFIDGGGYDGIPLEASAYQLGGKFEGNPKTIFSVEAEVTAWISGGRF